MKRETHISYSTVTLMMVVLLLLASCSTRKNTGANRAFHNVTAKYNVMFNGKEALKAGEAELAKKSKDNYTTTLPVYNYPPKNSIGSIYPQMDRVIEKASKCIYKHSMYIRGVEYVKSIDNAYYIMGMAHFHKQDYNQAQRMFSYIENTYKVSDIKEEAKIMNARTAVQMRYFSRAQDLLNEVDHAVYQRKSKKLNVMYNAAQAEYNLMAPEGEVEAALGYINEAIANRPKHDFKIRLYFIRGQLYEQQGQTTEAHESFLYVIKHSANYDMEFSARMHLATNYDGSRSARNSILKELGKMLEEKKNEDYRDQIYYALSEIDRIDGDVAGQKENLAKSVAAYTNNDYQRTFSAVALADIYFGEENYMDAQAYYDTATISIPKNYPDYDLIIKKSGVLRDLTDKIKEIQLQDSLQRIAKMSEGERNSWVQRMIAAYTEEERRAQQEENERMAALQATAGMANINVNNTQNGKWYFYNTSLISAGQTEFYRRWGNRKLEDNWRISNKQQISFEEMAEMNDPNAVKDSVEYDEDGNPIPKRETDPKKPAYYTQDLPLTAAAMDSSNAIVADAMYVCALIYMEQLGDYPRANETLKKLIERFPEHDLSLSAMYILYLNYEKSNEMLKSDIYKNHILSQYPNSDYAKLIKDPNYYKHLEELSKQSEKKYIEAYLAYSQKNWNRTVALADEALPNCIDEVLASQFTYLRAVAVGQLKGEDTLKRALSNVIIKYPSSEVAELARIYLSNFTRDLTQALADAGDKEAQKQKEKEEKAVANPYVMNDEETHYVILIFSSSAIPMQTVKDKVANFNREFFSLDQFNVNSFFINKTDQMVTISKFKNKSKALDYYHIFVNNPIMASHISARDFVVYAISASNYTTYYNKKDKRDLYPEFFQENYLNDIK